MGEHNVQGDLDPRKLREFMKALLDDVRALELMIEENMFESGIRRIGAEQELFLTDKSWQPAPAYDTVLKAVDDPDFTTELARFNLEFNCDPLTFGGDCLSKLEDQIQTRMEKVRIAAEAEGYKAVMIGILPTLQKSDLGLDNMTPMPRYFALNKAMTKLSGGAYLFRIKGTDEFLVQHDSVMLESCNTSFQIHFQVSIDEFARFYNISQAVLGPVLAAGSNSPLLFGKRLWHETRIALFQQSIDTRGITPYQRELNPRVSFGNSWIKESVVEIFKEDIARFRVLLGTDLDGDPFEAIKAGRPPSLKALRLHNGTIYRWNRPCYGISDNGMAHLRIENRVLPSGPTVLDAVSNAAFFFGLMSGLLEKYNDITEVLEFDDVKNNFLSAARLGLGAQFTWIDGETFPAKRLICDQLLPLAREGLLAARIRPEDVDRYLSVVEARVETGQTGSQWLLKSLGSFKNRGTKAERLAALTAGAYNRQLTNEPVHTWDLANLDEAGGWESNYLRVEQYMTTDVLSVNENELVELVANLMDWHNIRHVPVEDDEHKLVGLVSHRNLLRLLGRGVANLRETLVPVRDIMQTDPMTIPPSTPTVEAIRLMRTQSIACLPVVYDGKLIGIVTERDFMKIAGVLLQETLERV